MKRIAPGLGIALPLRVQADDVLTFGQMDIVTASGEVKAVSPVAVSPTATEAAETAPAAVTTAPSTVTQTIWAGQYFGSLVVNGGTITITLGGAAPAAAPETAPETTPETTPTAVASLPRVPPLEGLPFTPGLQFTQK